MYIGEYHDENLDGLGKALKKAVKQVGGVVKQAVKVPVNVVKAVGKGDIKGALTAPLAVLTPFVSAPKPVAQSLPVQTQPTGFLPDITAPVATVGTTAPGRVNPSASELWREELMKRKAAQIYGNTKQGAPTTWYNPATGKIEPISTSRPQVLIKTAKKKDRIKSEAQKPIVKAPEPAPQPIAAAALTMPNALTATPTPVAAEPVAAAESKPNYLLYGGIAAAALGAAFLFSRKKK